MVKTKFDAFAKSFTAFNCYNPTIERSKSQ